MGDDRFRHPLRRVEAAADRQAAIRGLRDDEVVQAIAGASREGDPYLANVLATEALNRLSRKTAIVESAAQGLVTVDPDGRIHYANPATERMTGTIGHAMKGQPILEFLRLDPEGADDPADDAWSRTLEASSTGQTRLGLLRKADGGWRSVEWSLVPLEWHGEREGHVLTLTDVSARERVEQELAAQREVQTLLLKVQDDLQEGVVLLEGERIAHVNEAFLRLLCCHNGQLRTVDDLIGCIVPDERDDFRERLGSALSANSGERRTAHTLQRFELKLQRGDQRHVVTEALLDHVRQGDRVTTALVLRDVTLRRFVGEAMRASERELRASFTHAPTALALLDADGRWLRANDVACELLGTSVTRLRTQRWADAFDPARRAVMEDAFRRCLEGDVSHVEAATRARQDAPLDIRLRRAASEPGRPAQVVVTLALKEPSEPEADATQASATPRSIGPRAPARPEDGQAADRRLTQSRF